jgi:hypothetical protein
MILRSLSFLSRRVLTAFALAGLAAPVALACPPETGDAMSTGILVARAEPGYGTPSGTEADVTPSRSHLTLVGAAIAKGVERRDPIDEGDSFDPAVGALYAWVKVRNLGEDTTITMVWKRDGKTKLAVSLPVGHSYGWKTWSKKRIAPREVGLWTVEVLDAEGLLVGSVGFEVAGAGTQVGAR